MLVALWAALAMILQDVLATNLVQAEARNRALLAAALDCAYWLCQISVLTICVTALQGNDIAVKAVVVAAVTAANFVGTYGGVRIGKRFIKESK